jgi:hypothetical protein
MFRFLLAASLITACSQTVDNGPRCAAVRSFFDEAQSKLISSGACDNEAVVTRCYAHQALEEAFIASLKENRCQSKTK